MTISPKPLNEHACTECQEATELPDEVAGSSSNTAMLYTSRILVVLKQDPSSATTSMQQLHVIYLGATVTTYNNIAINKNKL